MEDTWKIPRPSLTPLNPTGGGPTAEGGGAQYQVNIAQVFSTGTKSDLSECRVTVPGMGNMGSHVQDWVDGKHWKDTASEGSGESIAQSHSSGSLLLSAERLEGRTVQPLDTQSIASSTHFTVVNGVSPSKPPLTGCCRLHQLPILVISMTAVLFLAILAAVLYIQMRIAGSDG